MSLIPDESTFPALSAAELDQLRPWQSPSFADGATVFRPARPKSICSC